MFIYQGFLCTESLNSTVTKLLWCTSEVLELREPITPRSGIDKPYLYVRLKIFFKKIFKKIKKKFMIKFKNNLVVFLLPSVIVLIVKGQQ